MKKTWKLLPKIFGDQFRITEREAIKILEESIYSKHWKHGPAGAAGIMWRDEEIKELFNFVLLEEDILVKKVGRKKVQKELFWRSPVLRDFVHKSGLLYKKNTAGYKTFKNDYGKWKRLKYFKPSWKRGTKTPSFFKLRKRVRAKNKKFEDLIVAGNEKLSAGQAHTTKLIKSGEWEITPLGLRKIPK